MKLFEPGVIWKNRQPNELSILVELDGVACNNSERLKTLPDKDSFVYNIMRDGGSYTKNMGNDPRVNNVIYLVNYWHRQLMPLNNFEDYSFRIIVVTERTERFRTITKHWIDRSGMWVDELHMRPNNQPDIAAYKQDMLTGGLGNIDIFQAIDRIEYKPLYAAQNINLVGVTTDYNIITPTVETSNVQEVTV